MDNVVLVTIDSLRADRCGYLSGGDLTPAIDALADEGMAFENAIAPGPSTPESMPAVLSGSYPVDDDREYGSLLDARRFRLHRHLRAHGTVAGRFARAGYATAAFSPNPYTSRYFGFDVGFDRYEDYVTGSRERLYNRVLRGALEGTALTSLFPVRVVLNWVQREEVFKPWRVLFEDVVGWVETVDEPYFLWVLVMDCHDPYLVPSRYRNQSKWGMYHANWRLWRQGHQPPFAPDTHDRLTQAYADAVTYADAFVDRLHGSLPGDPILAVHSDHGEAFGEHGGYGHRQHLYEENVHVPLVLAGGPVPDWRIERPVALDALPDLLSSLAGGGGLSEGWRPAGPARTRTLAGDRIALRSRNWKYVRRPDEEVLYDLAADAAETRDASTEHRDLVAACRDLATGWDGDRAERARLSRGAQELV